MLKDALVQACHKNKPVQIIIGDHNIRLEPTFLYAPPPPNPEDCLTERPEARNTECMVMGDALDPNNADENVIFLEHDRMSEPGTLMTRQSLRDTWSKTDNQEYTAVYMDGCRSSNPGLYVYKLFDNRYVWNAWNVLESYNRCLAFVLRPMGRFRIGSYHARIEAGVVIDREETVYEITPVYGDFTQANPMPDTLPNKFAQYDAFGREVIPLVQVHVAERRVPCVVNNRVSESVLQNMRRYVELVQVGNVGAMCVDWNPNEHDILATINDLSIPVSIRSFMLHCFNMLRMTRQPRSNRLNRVLSINGIHAMSVTPFPTMQILSYRFQWNADHRLRVPREHMRFFESLVMSDGYYIKNILSRGKHLDEIMEFTFVDGLLTQHGLTMQQLMAHPDSNTVVRILFLNREVISTFMYNMLYPDQIWPYSDNDMHMQYGNSIIRLNYGVVSNLEECVPI